MFQVEQAYADKHKDLKARVFLSAGVFTVFSVLVVFTVFTLFTSVNAGSKAAASDVERLSSNVAVAFQHLRIAVANLGHDREGAADLFPPLLFNR